MWQPGDEILFLFLFNLERAQRWSGVVRQRYVLSFHDDSFQIMSLDPAQHTKSRKSIYRDLDRVDFTFGNVFWREVAVEHYVCGFSGLLIKFRLLCVQLNEWFKKKLVSKDTNNAS